MDALAGLRQWLRCLAGRHEWVELQTAPDHAGGCFEFEFCLWCGERRWERE